jgi:Spy/CpxP family protein refolding chaperone
LEPGDIVVTDGSDRLRESAPVILPGDCIPAFPGAGAGHGGHKPGAHGPYGGASSGGHGGGCPTGERQAGQPNAASISAASGSVSSGGPGSADGSSDAAPAPAGSSQGVPGQGTAASAAGGSESGGGRTQAILAPLNLDAQQQLKAQAIFTKARGDAMSAVASAGDDPDAQRNARHQAMEQAFSQLEPILRPDQKAKLAQVRAQMAQHHGAGGGQP